MLQTISDKIRRGFSQSAKSYDQFSGLHREIADKLLVQVIKGPEPSALLDVGCGTGYLTGKLKKFFPKAKIVGLDIAQGMLEVADRKHEGIDWVLADSHKLPFSDGIFNMLISNLAYQWAGDLPQVFSEAWRVLAPNGVLVCTLFGFNTCQELFQSLDQARTGALQFTRLPNGGQIRHALVSGGFKDPKVSREHIKIEFKDMQALITWLKSIGANNLSREGFLGPEAMSRAAAIYRERFSYLQGVGATFEVIQVYAKK